LRCSNGIDRGHGVIVIMVLSVAVLCGCVPFIGSGFIKIVYTGEISR
jgi:hypothetical protein